ncbi:MAG: 50S ribosomal protein L1 [Promethearchaeia archaeon]
MKVDEQLLKRSIDAALELATIKKEGHEPKTRNFDETIDFIMNLKDLDLNDPKQRIDKELILPHDIRSDPSICVIASGEVYLKAKELDVRALNEDDLEALSHEEKRDKKKFVKNYKFFVVEDKQMRNVARYLARFLGPAGKMPKPFPDGYGIISTPEDLETAVDRYKRIVKIRVRKQPLVQTIIGKKSMDEEKLYENMETIVDYVVSQMPHRYNNIQSMYVKSTMGKPVKIDDEFLDELGV